MEKGLLCLIVSMAMIIPMIYTNTAQVSAAEDEIVTQADPAENEDGIKDASDVPSGDEEVYEGESGDDEAYEDETGDDEAYEAETGDEEAYEAETGDEETYEPEAGDESEKETDDLDADTFSPDDHRVKLENINVGAPITGVDGKKYLPVTVTFSAKGDIGDADAIEFLEGYLRTELKDGRKTDGINGLGMTLPRVKEDAIDGMSNAYSWEYNGSAGEGKGTLKYNIPILENNDTQTVEESGATGQVEVNGLKTGDGVTLTVETVFKTEVASEPVTSNEAKFTIEEVSNYPKNIKVDDNDPVGGKNVALAKFVSSDGRTNASQVVKWPKDQQSLSFTPAGLEGYTVSPSSYSFTKNGEVAVFTYTPDKTTVVSADKDVTLTVNYKVPDGYDAPPSQRRTGKPKEAYTAVFSPRLSGLAADKAVVEGVFGNADETVTVKYTKTTMEMLSGEKIAVCPPDRVFTYNGQLQTIVPERNGYIVEGGGSEILPGVYRKKLILNSGWKWSDNTTGNKIVTAAINPAPLTRLILRHYQCKKTGEVVRPDIVAVIANGLVVDPANYSVTYSDPTSSQPGIYSITVKANGNTCYSGSITETYGITEVFVLTCPDHGKETYCDSNQDAPDDGSVSGTHAVLCKYCNEVITGKDHENCNFDQIVAHGVDDDKNPTGKVLRRCTDCGQCIYDVTCTHPEHEWIDNGNGTHSQICKSCKKAGPTVNEAHVLKPEPIKSKVTGVEIYNGEYKEKCEKCSYYEIKTCDHKGKGRSDWTPRNGTYPNASHAPLCTFCKKRLFEETAKCTLNEWKPTTLTKHEAQCTICHQMVTDRHDFKGSRKITKVDTIPYKEKGWFTRYNYVVHYQETCKHCKGIRAGRFPYPQLPIQKWGDLRNAFDTIAKMNPDELQSFKDNSLGNGRYYLLIPAYMISAVYEATGTNSLDSTYLDGRVLTRWTHNDGEAGSVCMYDKNGKKIARYEPDHKAGGTLLLTADGDDPFIPVEEEEGTLESDTYQCRFTNAQGAALGINTAELMALKDGEHTITSLFTTGDEQNVAITMVFTISTVKGKKVISDIHPLGEMTDNKSNVVSMKLSKKQTVYTGGPVSLPKVSISSSSGTKYKEGKDYKLTYYQRTGKTQEDYKDKKISKGKIKEAGTYYIVAKATQNGALMGETSVSFEVVKANIKKATVSGLKDKTYTGKAIKQSPTVKFNSKKLKSGKDYTVSYKNNIKAGTATITIKGKGNFKNSITRKFKINKAKNPLAVKSGKTVTVSKKEISKAAQKVSLTELVSYKKKGQGKLTYSLSKVDKKYKKYFKVNNKTGMLEAKKGLPGGSYKITLKVKAKGNSNYKASGYKKFTCNIKVK